MENIDKVYNAVRDRIFEAMKFQRVSQKEFAKELGISPQTVTDWKTGKSRSFANGRMLQKIAFTLAINNAWLWDGVGPMTKYEKAVQDGTLLEDPLKKNTPIPASNTISEEAHRVALAYDKADEKSRAMVRLALNLDMDVPLAAHGGPSGKISISAKTAETLEKGAVESTGDI